MQTILLARLISLVESGGVQAPLFDPATVSDPSMSNATFLKQYIANLLQNAFTHMQPAQLNAFVNLMFEHASDPAKFKFTLRDFLISLKEFSGGDNADLFIDEKEAEADRKAAAERENAMRVPGMLKPAQIDDDAEL